jgi:hypothetical protein
MANVSTGNPWILDTAGTILAKGNIVRVKKMIFYASAASDDVDVQDGAGNSVWKCRAAAAGTNYEDYAGVETDWGDNPIPMNGFIVGTIDGAGSSELWVYLV